MTVPHFNPPDLAPLLAPKQVQTLLNVSRSTLARMQTAGQLKPVRLLGNVVRFRRNDIEALLNGTAPEPFEKSKRRPRVFALGRRPGRPRKQPILPNAHSDDDIV